MLLLAGGTALRAIRIGTDGPETLVGADKADTLTGKSGDATDSFTDGFGFDTVEERVSYRVGRKKVHGGVDALNFSRVGADVVDTYFVPEWGPDWQRSAYGAGGSGGADAADVRPLAADGVDLGAISPTPTRSRRAC